MGERGFTRLCRGIIIVPFPLAPSFDTCMSWRVIRPFLYPGSFSFVMRNFRYLEQIRDVTFTG
jgi:hypothetical protein